MNAISDIGAAQAIATGAAETAPQTYTLRRTGQKALRFEGWQIIEATGARLPEAVSYDLNIYRSDAGAIIAELIARRGTLGEQDTAHVEVFADLAAAAAWLETFPINNDIPVPDDLAGDDGAVASAVLKAIKLRQRIAAISDDYRGLLSDVFEALDLTETPISVGRTAAEQPAPSL